MASDNQEKPVFCVRNQMLKPVAEHTGCPYCFGRRALSVGTADRTEFCDFDPASDPVSLGFPPGTTRGERG